ncbi:MAG: NAD-dependent epimerase/dehydratase family protein [Acidobacteriia bacterium]|nr:NAD-dependent epimerase/dehydratase family protein [Terriglobia bacterium]
MSVLVTGARGFIGRNLTAHLQATQGCEATLYDIDNSPDDLRAGLETADIVYHLAGVNRPQVTEGFESGNAGLTRELCAILRELGRAPIIVISSSVQAELDNPYGASKRRAEDALREFAVESGAQVRIYRLKNVFGKWCRPNYNSVVATFCHNIANDLPIQVSDPGREVELVYVDDVVKAFLADLPLYARSKDCRDIPSFKLTLGELAGRIQSFHDLRASLLVPDFAIRFNQQLYATYLSYVPHDARRRQLEIKADQRGGLAEFIKSTNFGQIFISRTRPGITRGNHYHHTKAEKFFVVEGEGVIRMRQIERPEVREYRVCGEAFQVIDIPPGYTHSIENVGAGEMVTLFWASEIFDPDCPDTYFLPVLTSVRAESTVGDAV